MKKIVLILIGLVMILSVGCTQKENLGESSKKIIVGLDDHFPPMGYRDDEGEIVGFDIDLAKELGKRSGYRVEFKAVDWDGVLLSLNNGDIDVIWNGLTITEERKKKIAFSEPYLKNNQIIIVRDTSDINGKKDLKNALIGVQMGSSSEIVVQALRDKGEISEIKKFSNNVEALLDLKANRLDAVVVDEVVGRFYVSKQKDGYRVLEDTLGGEEYGVGLRKEDEELRELIDNTLNEMKSDGTYDKIKEKWFGK